MITCCARVPIVIKAVSNPNYDRNGMQSFRNMKRKMLLNTTKYLAIGTCVASILKGVEGAEVFLYGGALGIINQWLMQNEVESIGSIRSVYQLLNNTILRMFLTAAIIYVTFILSHQNVETWELGGAFTGFLMNKVGMIDGYITEEIGPDTIQDRDRGLD